MINITEEIIVLTGPWSGISKLFIYNLQCEHMIRAFKITNFHLERENSFRIAKQLQRVEERGSNCRSNLGNKRRTTTRCEKCKFLWSGLDEGLNWPPTQIQGRLQGLQNKLGDWQNVLAPGLDSNMVVKKGLFLKSVQSSLINHFLTGLCNKI